MIKHTLRIFSNFCPLTLDPNTGQLKAWNGVIALQGRKFHRIIDGQTQTIISVISFMF